MISNIVAGLNLDSATNLANDISLRLREIFEISNKYSSGIDLTSEEKVRYYQARSLLYQVYLSQINGNVNLLGRIRKKISSSQHELAIILDDHYSSKEY